MLPLLALFFCSLFFHSALGMLINVTIDDTNPEASGSSITYLPDGAWNTGTNCTGCTAHPDPSQLFDGTWHDGTFNPLSGSNNFPNQTLTASVSFNGTAVYVFCALARTSTSPDGDSDMTFFIDGQLAGTFVKTAPNTTGYDYGVSVFSTTSLSSGVHNLTLQTGHVGGVKSLVLLDSIVYTFDDGEVVSSSSSPSTSSSPSSPTQTQTIIEISNSASPTSQSGATSSNNSNIGSIVGPAVAVPLVVIALTILATLFYCRRHRRRLSFNGISDQRLVIDPILPLTTGTARNEPVSIPQAGPSRAVYVNGSGVPSSFSGSNTAISQAAPAPPLHPLRPTNAPSTSNGPHSHYTFTALSSDAGWSQSQNQNQTRSGVSHRTQPSTIYTTQSGWTSQSAGTGAPGATQGSSYRQTQSNNSAPSAGVVVGEEEYLEEDPPAYESERARSFRATGGQKVKPLVLSDSRQTRLMNQ